jgi:hypothetical protein
MSNCMDVVAREVRRLPVFPLDSADGAACAALMAELLASYGACVTVRQRRGGRIRGDESNFDVRRAKPIIDAIDRTLAASYDFGAEELDFILNYDIKYRLGRHIGGEGQGKAWTAIRGRPTWRAKGRSRHARACSGPARRHLTQGVCASDRPGVAGEGSAGPPPADAQPPEVKSLI